MTLQGKGFFIWQIPDCEGGNPVTITATAQAAGLSHVLIKIADGSRPFGIDVSGRDLAAPVVKALQSAGITVWGWHYVYGNDPAAEAEIAIRRVRELALDGYVLDAEAEYKNVGRENSARLFMSQLRAALDVPITLSSYRFPNYHPELPWATLLESCDYHMPQVYWEAAHNAGWQLRESKRQCDALPNARPYIPVGSVYGSLDSWNPTPEDVTEFLFTARELGLKAVNYYSWDYCRKHLPQLWKTIASFPWPVPEKKAVSTARPPTVTKPVTPSGQSPIAPPDSFTAQYLSALNSQQAEKIAALYDPNAIHVFENKVFRGMVAIQNEYSSFYKTHPVVPFNLADAEINGDVRYLTWRTGTHTAQTTIVLRDGKIVLDYMSLT